MPDDFLISRKQANHYYVVDLFLLIFGMLVCGFLSVFFGKELSWDLLAYHYYNPYAFLHQRMNVLDYWDPSAIQAFLTPTLDFFSYYLINHFSPRMTEFILGAVHGINFGIIFFISRFFIRYFVSSYFYQFVIAFIAAVFGIYAPTVLSGIGAFFNDNTVNIFIVGFILWFISLLKKLQHADTVPRYQLFLAHSLLGIAAGAKLTAGIFIFGSLVGLVLLPFSSQKKIQVLFYSLVGIMVGFLLTDGYWMWFLWKHYQNPFFPFFNSIFHSPYFPPISWGKSRFLPKNAMEAVFFPFYFSSSLRATVEDFFIDYRFAVIYPLFVFFGAAVIDKKNTAVIRNFPLWWFYLFFIFSYIVWEIYFSAMRYLGVLQMLAPIAIILLVLQTFTRFKVKLLILVSIFVFLLLTMSPTGMARVEFGDSFFNVKLPSIVKKTPEATVILAYSDFTKIGIPQPNNYLIPFFPSAWRFTGIPFNIFKYYIPAGVKHFVQQGPKQIYLLASQLYIHSMYKAAKELNLEPNGPCSTITSDHQKLNHNTILLCPVKPV